MTDLARDIAWSLASLACAFAAVLVAKAFVDTLKGGVTAIRRRRLGL